MVGKLTPLRFNVITGTGRSSVVFTFICYYPDHWTSRCWSKNNSDLVTWPSKYFGTRRFRDVGEFGRNPIRNLSQVHTNCFLKCLDYHVSFLFYLYSQFKPKAFFHEHRWDIFQDILTQSILALRKSLINMFCMRRNFYNNNKKYL